MLPAVFDLLWAVSCKLDMVATTLFRSIDFMGTIDGINITIYRQVETGGGFRIFVGVFRPGTRPEGRDPGH